MPNGNVGTPTSVFLELIQQCKLPPAVIKKLGLSFPKMRSNKRYGSVPFTYEPAKQVPVQKTKYSRDSDEHEDVLSGRGHVLKGERDVIIENNKNEDSKSAPDQEKEENILDSEEV
jgi:hypothetical protein